MGKDDKTWLNLSLLAFAAGVGYVTVCLLDAIDGFYNISVSLSYFSVLRLVLAALAAGLAVRKVVSDTLRRDYLLATIKEVRKVTWPTGADTKSMTVQVAVVVSIFACILTVFDLAWARTLQYFLP